jgi:hypothetical protein
MTKEQILGMLAEGYNLNQIAAIKMISKQTLQDILDADACAPIIKKSKDTSGTSGTSGVTWLNEENI